MSGQSTNNNNNKKPLLLLLFIGLGCIATTFGQRLAVPTRQLLAPSSRFAESFETFDGNANGDDDSSGSDGDGDGDGDGIQSTQDQLRQLLGQELSSAVAPLNAAPLAVLSGRQPAIVAPRSGLEAALRFANSGDEADSSEEDSDEAENDSDTETDTEPQQEYNPYRDNFNERNEDGSYVFGYALPNGVRRWERGFFSEDQHHGLVVEGFYAQPRHYGHGVQYELRCYRADAYGYHPLAVEYLQQPPRVRRDELPNVRCLNINR